MTSDGHLEGRDVAGYLDRAVGPAERDTIESHLVDCSECRDEVIQVSRLRRVNSPRRKWYLALPVAAAAVLTLMLLPSADPDGPMLRDGNDREPIALTLVAPADSAGTSIRSPHVFIWRAMDNVVSYRFTITDDSGDVVWTATSADTTIQLPTSIKLRPELRYFWYVDALLPDGRSVASRVRTLGKRR